MDIVNLAVFMAALYDTIERISYELSASSYK